MPQLAFGLTNSSKTLSGGVYDAADIGRVEIKDDSLLVEVVLTDLIKYYQYNPYTDRSPKTRDPDPDRSHHQNTNRMTFQHSRILYHLNKNALHLLFLSQLLTNNLSILDHHWREHRRFPHPRHLAQKVLRFLRKSVTLVAILQLLIRAKFIRFV